MIQLTITRDKLNNVVKGRVRMMWTCSDYSYHQHRWRWTAWLCGRVQYWVARLKAI